MRALEVTTRFPSFADFWTPSLGGAGPAPAYVTSSRAERRGALALRLDRALPFAPDGSIALVARAWAVRGVVG